MSKWGGELGEHWSTGGKLVGLQVHVVHGQVQVHVVHMQEHIVQVYAVTSRQVHAVHVIGTLRIYNGLYPYCN